MNVRKLKLMLAVPLVMASALGSAAAWAQEGGGDGAKAAKRALDFYGMIDVGVESVSGTMANSSKTEGLRVSNGIITPHFGVRGSSELTDGMRGMFHLEGSFASDNGTSGIGGRLLGRQAWVGLQTDYGTLQLGRQYTAVRMGWEDANPYGTGNQGIRLLDARISNPRADNAINYRGKWGGVTAEVTFSPGWDAVNGNAANTGPANAAGSNCAGEVPDVSSRCKAVAMGVKYAAADWGVAVSHEKLNGGTTATFGGLTASTLTDKRTVLGAYYNLSGGKKLTAGWVNRNNEGNVATPKSDMYWVEAIVPFGGKYSIDGVVAQLKYDNSPNKATLINVRGRYFLNKETTLYVAASNLKNGGSLALPATASTPVATPKAGTGQTSIIAGVLYRF